MVDHKCTLIAFRSSTHDMYFIKKIARTNFLWVFNVFHVGGKMEKFISSILLSLIHTKSGRVCRYYLRASFGERFLIFDIV